MWLLKGSLTFTLPSSDPQLTLNWPSPDILPTWVWQSSVGDIDANLFNFDAAARWFVRFRWRFVDRPMEYLEENFWTSRRKIGTLKRLKIDAGLEHLEEISFINLIFIFLRTPVKTRNSYWKLKNRYIKRFLNSFLLEFSFPNEFHSVSIKDTAKPQNQINFRTGDYGHPRRTHGQSIGWGGDYKSALLEYQEKELESGLA